MNARTFQGVPAVREQTPILFGIAGASGGGKTFSALRAAKGIVEVLGGEIYFIDTDNRRALQYADVFRKPDGSPGFIHVPFNPPHGSDDYVAAIRYCLAQADCGCIVIDSLSHEHEGIGGMIEFHEAEHKRMGGTEGTKMLAWSKPKAARRRLLLEIQRLNKPAIFCFRAKEGAKPIKVTDPSTGRAKTEVVQTGFVQIGGDEFAFEMTLHALLMPAAGGVPEWNPLEVGERKMTKLPAQFESLRGSRIPIDEELGRNLAKWARGGVKRPAAPPPPAEEEQPSQQAETRQGVDDRREEGGTRAASAEEIAQAKAARQPESREDRLADRGFSGEGLGGEPLNTDQVENDGGEGFPGDRPQDSAAGGQAAVDRPASPAASSDKAPDSSATAASSTASGPGAPDQVDFGFSDLAEACALSTVWPQLKTALTKLTAGHAWKAASPEMQANARKVVFHRLAQLVHEGYRFDYLDDAHAFRCYLEHETDPHAIVGNGRAFRVSAVWKALPEAAQAQFDRAQETRLGALGYTPEATAGDFS